MTDIVLYDRTGQAVTYPGADSITTDTPEEGVTAKFTHGELLKGVTAAPDFSGGDQVISVPDGYLVREATIIKPETLIPENIKYGEVIAGIEGTLIGDTEEVTVPLDMAAGDQVITPSTEIKVLSKVTIQKPETLKPENIAEGVEIAGIVGTKGTLEDELIMGTVEGDYENPLVASLRPYAFAGYSNGINLSFPNCSVIGRSAFLNASVGDVYLGLAAAVAISAFYYASVKTLNLPSCSIIEQYAFWSGTVEKGFFPEVTYISSSAFYLCKGAMDLSFPKCKTIGPGAFRSASLTYADFPECTYFAGGGAFASCKNLSRVSFPKLSVMFGGAFSSCIALEEAVFPLCSPDQSAFYYCSKLSLASFPTAKSIGSSAFTGCSMLTETYFPEVSLIGSNAFRGCTALASLSFPECTAISSYAFSGCSKLMRLDLPGPVVPSLSGGEFNGTPMSVSTYTGAFGSIYVPASLVESYRAAAIWSLFSARITALEDATE